MVDKDVVVVAKHAIETFFDVFEAGTVIGLILPDGWFGRPYDNYYELQGVFTSGDLLEMDLGWGWKVSLIPANTLLSKDKCALTITGSQIAVSTIDSSKRYDGGNIRFVVDETSSIVQKLLWERGDRFSDIIPDTIN